MQVRTRIAPTPSGFLHLGNLYSFILTWLICRSQNGHLLLRIDDLDSARTRKDYLEDIFETLDWAGIEPDEGPSGLKHFQQEYSQKKRMNLYRNMLQQLADSGKVYACTCTRKTIHHLYPDHIYRGFCRESNISLGKSNTSRRIQVQGEIQFFDSYTGEVKSVDLLKEMGDFVIRRKDGLPSYQVASLADDLYFKINTIVRGEDLINSTASQLFLARAIDKPAFDSSAFYHHTLILNAHQEKLSKSSGHRSLKWMRNQGYSKKMMLEEIAGLLGVKNIKPDDLNGLLEEWTKCCNLFFKQPSRDSSG